MPRTKKLLVVFSTISNKTYFMLIQFYLVTKFLLLLLSREKFDVKITAQEQKNYLFPAQEEKRTCLTLDFNWTLIPGSELKFLVLVQGSGL